MLKIVDNVPSSSEAQLRERLEHIGESPDFSAFFERFVKRAPNTIKKGTLIFNEGDPLGRLYYIKEGFVKLYRLTSEGRDGTTYLLGPGNLLGLRALLSDDESAKHHAEAITDAKILTVSRKEYLDAIMHDPRLLVDLMHAYIERLNYTEQKLVGYMFTDATARVAYFLQMTAKRFGKKENNMVALPVPLTHQLIADFVGSFRETVSVALKKLEKEGAIKTAKGIITIQHIENLEKYASGEVEV